MTARPEARAWLATRGLHVGDLRVSKYYVAEESFWHVPGWWFEIPTMAVVKLETHFDLLGRNPTGDPEFIHFRVPPEFLVANKAGLGFREQEDKFSLFISAEQKDLWREVRGPGGVDFGRFRVD